MKAASEIVHGFACRRMLAGAAICLAVATGAGAAVELPGGREGWWSTRWEYRLQFDVPAARTGLPGRDVGVVEFHAPTVGLHAEGGRLKDDASDLRVVAGSLPVGHRLLVRRADDDFVRVAFELRGGGTHYSVYLGNPNARAPPEAPRLKRGCLLETFELAGGSPGNLAGMRDILRRAEGRPYGADFVPNVFHGHNPFGPQENFVSRYTGWLDCPNSGVYTFCTSSDDASFLLVDGDLVVQWPGWHGAVADTRFRGRKKLQRGIHELEYLHVQGGDKTIAVAAWKPPSARRILPIPPESFGPVARGELLRIQRLGARPAPHFEVSLEGETRFEGRRAVRARFVDRTGEMGAGRIARWEFGDGTTAQGDRVDHVYLRRGVFGVRLEVRGGGKTASVTSRVRIERPWRRIATRGQESAGRYARIARGYDLATIETASLEPLALLWKSVGAKEAEERVLREVVRRGGETDKKVYFEAVRFVARRLRDDEKTRPEVLALLDAAERVLRGNANLRARVIRERGDVYLYYEQDYDRALGEYDKVVGRFAESLEDHIVRITKIRIGDVFRKKGAYDRARGAYRDAERFRIHGIAGDPAVRRGVLLQTAETELARRNLKEAREALDILEWEFPLERLNGPASVLRARIELRAGNTAEALVQLDDFLRVAPRSNSAPEALFLAARIERLLGRTAEAVRRYERLAEDYPDSPRAAEAAELTGKLRQK
jgi:tetratricopeptide (TPR) repeat protein